LKLRTDAADGRAELPKPGEGGMVWISGEVGSIVEVVERPAEDMARGMFWP
jgi:hypothetical protein